MPYRPLPDERLAAKLRDAQHADQRVLLVGCSKISDPCRRFFEMYFGDGQSLDVIRSVLANYTLLAIDTSEESPKAARPIFDRLKLSLPSAEEATFAVLDSEGRLVASATARELSSDDHLNGPKVFAFLKKHAQPQPDAERLLADALAEAKRDDKRVLFVQSTNFSAPCLLLSRFLDDHKEVLAKDYVLVKIDRRFKNGRAVIDRIRKAEENALPWMAILDAAGKPLITSTGPGGNIGFPIEPAGVAHFETMLRTTARRMSADELRSLRDALLGAG
jgi:hypothetical protein